MNNRIKRYLSPPGPPPTALGDIKRAYSRGYYDGATFERYKSMDPYAAGCVHATLVLILLHVAIKLIEGIW